MRNITLSADEQLIESARQKAQAQKTTLNAEFRKWLRQYTNTENEGRQRVQAYRQLMQSLSGVSTGGGKFEPPMTTEQAQSYLQTTLQWLCDYYPSEDLQHQQKVENLTIINPFVG